MSSQISSPGKTAVLVAITAGACVTAESTNKPAPADAPAPAGVNEAGARSPELTSQDQAAAPPTTAASAARPVLVIHDPAQLEPWRAPLDFGVLLFAQPNASTKKLRKSAAYRSLIVSLSESSRGSGFSFGNSFPKWWLGHPRTHFELVGVVNRLDRRDMRPGTCGETRLLYRLEHRSELDQRRLPASFNVVFEQPDDGKDCADVAKSWFVEGDAHGELDQPGRPLHAERLSLAHLLAIEVNLRADDPDSDATTNGLSVHGYDAATDRYSRIGFEFELSRILWKGRGWRRLVDELTSEAMLEAARVGTPKITAGYPAGWDAELSAPSRQLGLLLEAMKNAKHTPADFGPFPNATAVSHRLQTLTCSGCHRQRSVGGFHLPGEGGPSQLKGGLSAHLLSELPWRRDYVEAVAAGKTPDNVRKHPHAGPPGFGESCSTEASPVADLSCQPHHRCEPVAGADFGTCLPESYAGPGPCDAGADPNCKKPSQWFPGGFLARACDGEHACAPVPTNADVRKCAQDKDPWTCVNTRAESFIVDPCDDQAACRDGYVCTNAASGSEGVCVPAKAVAELRTRGHSRVVR